MSIRYQVFGIPANIDEVVDRAKRTGEVPEVHATKYPVPTLDTSGYTIEYKVRIQIGWTKVLVDGWKREFSRLDRYGVPYEDTCLQRRAKRVANELSQREISVLYNGEIYFQENSQPAE